MENTKENSIDSFTDEYSFLSNFYESPITENEIKYPTVEHYFQAHKAKNMDDHWSVVEAPTPKAAKKVGRSVPLRDDWPHIKTKIMYNGLCLKFEQHPDLAEKLLDTSDAVLIEGNWWKDTTWGVYKGRGLNLLGNLLMIVREQLKP